MAAFKGKLGLQFVIHLANRYTANQLVELAGLAHRRGFERIWVNDNARYRSQVVVLAAIAARVPIGIGTAILVPYLHHPIEVVDSLATLSELAEGREIGFGLARGDLAQTPQNVEGAQTHLAGAGTGRVRIPSAGRRARPLRRLPGALRILPSESRRQLRACLQAEVPGGDLFRGQRPPVAAHGRPGDDGLISSGTFIPMLRAGRLREMHEAAEAGARSVDPNKTLRKMVELNVSVSRDRDAAIEFPKRQVSHSILQWEALKFTPEEYARLGVERGKGAGAQGGVRTGRHHRGSRRAGDRRDGPELLRRRASRGGGGSDRGPCRQAQVMGYDEIAFAKLGPDYEEAINMLADSVMPRLKG